MRLTSSRDMIHYQYDGLLAFPCSHNPQCPPGFRLGWVITGKPKPLKPDSVLRNPESTFLLIRCCRRIPGKENSHENEPDIQPDVTRGPI
jgi:hypothetical protein